MENSQNLIQVLHTSHKNNSYSENVLRKKDFFTSKLRYEIFIVS
jgi:hypothetical protein